MNIVSSFFEGRVRFRGEIFKNPQIALATESLLQSINGVECFKINNVTGSLLVEYDPIKLPFKKLKDCLPILQHAKDSYERGTNPEEVANIIKNLEKNFS